MGGILKVLLTGATGFLGKYIVEELKNNSYEVIGFARNEKIGKELDYSVNDLRKITCILGIKSIQF